MHAIDLPIHPSLVHPLTGQPLQAVGIVNDRPVWPVLGGAEDDENDLDIDDGDEDEGDNESDAATGYKPPSEEEWKRTQAALKKANAQALKFRNRSKNNTSPAASGEVDAEALREQITTEAESTWKPRVVATEAKAQLIAMGYKSDNYKRLTKLIDLDEVTVDEDGDVIGLEEQLNELKDEYPDMFDDEKKSTRGRVTAAGRKAPASDGKKRSSADLIAARVLGKK